MSSSNRVQVVSVEEVTLGTTPNTPRMRKRRMTGEQLRFAPTFVQSDEVRDDRMESDPIQTGTESGGPINFELHYPFPGSPLDSDIKSAMFNTWTSTPSRDNDGVADSVITDVAESGGVITVANGDAFVANQLVRLTGFTNAENNGVFKLTTGSATAPAVGSSILVDESAPPATARMKVVGFQGDSGDITATASGLGSSSLNFTTLGLVVGQWIKIGGTATSDKFGTAACNGWARITAIGANALTLDNLPSGWTTDAGTSKTIKVWFGDTIKNGTTRLGQSIEKGFLGQDTPTYILAKGQVAGQFSMNLTAKQKITGSVTFMGMSGTESTSPQDASPDAALSLSSFPVFACSANVGRVGEAGSTLSSPNFVRMLEFTINNNLEPTEAVDSQGPQDITGHSCTVTGRMETYFGDNTLLTKFFNGTASSLNVRATKGTQAFIVGLPRITYNGDGSPNAAGRNQQVMLPLAFQASKDEATTSCQVQMDRFEYFE